MLKIKTPTLLKIVIVAMLVSLSGCLDPIANAIDNAIRTLESQSNSWRSVLEDTRDVLVDQAQSTIRNEINSALTNAIAAAGSQVQCVIDAIPHRVLNTLYRVRAMWTNNPVPAREPLVCAVVPSSIDLSLVPNRLNVVHFYGYDFDIFHGDFRVLLQNGNQQTDVSRYLDQPTDYEMTLNLSGTNGLQFSSTSTRLILTFNNTTMGSIGIQQPPPPVLSMPDCVWSGYVTDGTSASTCPSGFALKGIRCTGEYCDNMSLRCCPYTPAGDNQAYTSWVGEISDESSRNERQFQNGFIDGLYCTGDYCDNISIRLLQSPKLLNQGQCYWTEYVSEEQGEMLCIQDYLASGLRCRGDYCDSVSLWCCRTNL